MGLIPRQTFNALLGPVGNLSNFTPFLGFPKRPTQYNTKINFGKYVQVSDLKFLWYKHR